MAVGLEMDGGTRIEWVLCEGDAWPTDPSGTLRGDNNCAHFLPRSEGGGAGAGRHMRGVEDVRPPPSLRIGVPYGAVEAIRRSGGGR